MVHHAEKYRTMYYVDFNRKRKGNYVDIHTSTRKKKSPTLGMPA